MHKQMFCLVLAASGCVDAVDGDRRDDSFSMDGKADAFGIVEGSPEALGVLAVVNGSTEAQLRSDVGLSRLAAGNIADHGQPVRTLAELDDVPFVGSIAFHKLLEYAQANGFIVDEPTTEPVGQGILLDCNTATGPDQQVTVIGDGTRLTLRELTTSGSQVDRPLSTAEWSSHTLNLREDFGSMTTLSKDGGSWIARTFGGGFNEISEADCWVDTSD